MATPVNTSSFTPEQLSAFNYANSLGSGVQTTSAATAPVTPAPQIQSPAASTAQPAGYNANAAMQVPGATTVNVNTAPATQTPSQTPQNAQGATQTGQLVYDPAKNPSVIDLLNSTGGDSSKVGRTALAGQLGVQNYDFSAAKNIELAQKYTAAYNKLKTTPTPDTGAQASSQMDAHFEENKPGKTVEEMQKAAMDDYMAMNPVVKHLFDSYNTILSSTGTQQTYKEEFAKAFADESNPAGRPGESLSEEQLNYMNIKNIMEGSEDDIRDEITRAGGFATESQVQALTGARNKTLLKQANLIQQSMALKQDYVDQLMKFSDADRTQVEKDIDRKLGITEKVAELSLNMEKAARDNYKNILTAFGPEGFLDIFGNDEKAMNQAEASLGIPKGALKNEALMALLKKEGDRPLQFISGTENQSSGVFDPNTGAFTARSGGGSTGSGGSSTGGVSYPTGTTPATAAAINTALQVILGSGQFTKQQQANVTNAIARGEDPYTVIKNQAKNIMGQTLATSLSNNEKARAAMASLETSLDAYYAKGGKTDIFRGNYENVLAKVGEVKNPELRSLATEIESALQIYRNAVSGTAYSVQEGKAISTIFPGIDKTEGLNDAILRGRMKAFESVIDEAYGQVLGGNTYQQLKQAEGQGGGANDQKSSKFDYLSDFITSDDKKKKAYLPRAQWSKVEDKDGLLAYIKKLGYDLLIDD